MLILLCVSCCVSCVGLVDHFCNIFTDICAICLATDVATGTDPKAAGAMLLSLLDTLHAILKFVSDVVRKALQVRSDANHHSNAIFTYYNASACIFY